MVNVTFKYLNVLPLKGQLKKTNCLFDLVMYRLHELTEEEISIVERKVTQVTLYNPIILWYTFLCHHRSPSYSRS